MLEKIPPTEVNFIKDLGWNMEDSFYKPPEETLQWDRTMVTLQKYIHQPKEDWEWEVLSIFTTNTIEELKQKFA